MNIKSDSMGNNQMSHSSEPEDMPNLGEMSLFQWEIRQKFITIKTEHPVWMAFVNFVKMYCSDLFISINIFILSCIVSGDNQDILNQVLLMQKRIR